MFEEIRSIKIYAVTVNKIIQRLEELEDIDVEELQEQIEECFDGYDVEDVEELVGQETWGDYTQDGKHELEIRVNHPNSYEFTVHIETKDKKSSVVNVL
jgi:hypothetical protein